MCAGSGNPSLTIGGVRWLTWQGSVAGIEAVGFAPVPEVPMMFDDLGVTSLSLDRLGGKEGSIPERPHVTLVTSVWVSGGYGRRQRAAEVRLPVAANMPPAAHELA
jgi:hypothetical protein